MRLLFVTDLVFLREYYFGSVKGLLFTLQSSRNALFQLRAVSRYESGPLEAAVFQLSEYCPTNGALQRSDSNGWANACFGRIVWID